jgi:hypothetical protein
MIDVAAALRVWLMYCGYEVDVSLNVRPFFSPFQIFVYYHVEMKGKQNASKAERSTE